MNNYVNNNFPCGRSKFVNIKTWNRLVNSYSKFFKIGIFDCARDPYFCSIKGWMKPQLMLGYTDTKDSIKFLYHNVCEHNEYEHINKWLELTLRDRLIYPITKANSNKILTPAYTNPKPQLKIFYKRNSDISPQIPLYFATISLKYNLRAKFYHFEHTTSLNNHQWSSSESSQKYLFETIPIYLVIDNKICYNYGINLNELPSFTHPNLFLIFLYPDANNIFLISFFVLNSYLIMIFFEYNKSFVKQLLRGLMCLCIFNFTLFSIWLVQNSNFFSTEKTKVLAFLHSMTNDLFIWLRYFMMYNSITQRFVAHLRFIAFYHIYIQPYSALFLYILFLFMYNLHTRLNYFKLFDKSNSKSFEIESGMLTIGYEEAAKKSDTEIKRPLLK